jgi:hypothetical protein
MDSKHSTQDILNLLVRSAVLIEEVYTRNPELIHDDYAQDYSDIISALHSNSVYYRANPKILQMAHDYNPLKAFGKMPMEKAKKPKSKSDSAMDKRNAS